MNKVNKSKELVSYLIIITLIFALCAISYYTYKKEKYYQNNNVYIENKQNFGCKSNELNNRMLSFYKNLNNNVLKSFKIINSINPYNWINVAKAINKLKPDILINSYWSPYFSPCFFTINKMVSKKIKKIGIIHNAFPHESILFQKHLFKLYVNSIDEFICFSNKVKEQINLLIPKKKGKTIFHPVHEKFGDVVEKEKARNKLKLKKNIKYILFFGIIRAYKV